MNVSLANFTEAVSGSLQKVAESKTAMIGIAAVGWILAIVLLLVLILKWRNNSGKVSRKARELRGDYFQKVKTGMERNRQ